MNKMIKQTNPSIVFLQDTKCSMTQIQDLRKKIWVKCEAMGIDSRGFSGVLGILWDPTRVSLEVFQGTQYSLIANFRVVGFSISWKVTNVYAPQNVGVKK